MKTLCTEITAKTGASIKLMPSSGTVVVFNSAGDRVSLPYDKYTLLLKEISDIKNAPATVEDIDKFWFSFVNA